MILCGLRDEFFEGFCHSDDALVGVIDDAALLIERILQVRCAWSAADCGLLSTALGDARELVDGQTGPGTLASARQPPHERKAGPALLALFLACDPRRHEAVS